MLAGKPALTGAQIRAARAFLNWSVRELSDRSGVSQSAISRAERVEGAPTMQSRNLQALRTVFESSGLEFLDNTGVRISGTTRH
jgi:transcriptional regulator with XRE-family HTH domain